MTRKTKRAAAKAFNEAERIVLRDMAGNPDIDQAHKALYRFVTTRLLKEDDLEAMRDQLIQHCQFLDGLPDALEGRHWGRVPGKVVRRHLGELSGTEANIYLALVCCVNGRTLTTFVSNPRLAEMCDCSERTVSRGLRGLRRKGLIVRWFHKLGDWHSAVRHYTKLVAYPKDMTEEDWKLYSVPASA